MEKIYDQAYIFKPFENVKIFYENKDGEGYYLGFYSYESEEIEKMKVLFANFSDFSPRFHDYDTKFSYVYISSLEKFKNIIADFFECRIRSAMDYTSVYDDEGQISDLLPKYSDGIIEKLAQKHAEFFCSNFIFSAYFVDKENLSKYADTFNLGKM